MSFIGANFPDDYRDPPGFWASAADDLASDLTEATQAISKLYENLEAEMSVLDEKLAALMDLAADREASSDDINDAEALKARMQAALRVLQGGVA